LKKKKSVVKRLNSIRFNQQSTRLLSTSTRISAEKHYSKIWLHILDLVMNELNFPVPSGQYGDTKIRLPSTPIPVHCSPIIQSFHALEPQLLKALLNKLQINEVKNLHNSYTRLASSCSKILCHFTNFVTPLP
jgi:hypothetical protein